MKPHVAVIGAGIAGITAAYWLAQEGYRVTVLEQASYPAMMTSRANGGQLSACNAETWTQWSMIHKAITWMFDPSAPFKLSWQWDWAKIKWIAAFVGHTLANSNQERTEETIRLILHSRQALKQIVDQTAVEFDHVSRGILHVYTNPLSWRQAETKQQWFEERGVEWQPHDVPQLAVLEPSLAHSSFVGGIFTSGDSTGDIHLFCNNLATWLKQNRPVQFEFDRSIRSIRPHNQGVEVDGVQFDAVVLSAGVWSNRLAHELGDNLGIYPVKGYSITVNLDPQSQAHAPWVSLLDDDAKIVCSRLGASRLRVAGTAELSGINRDILQERIDPLLAWTARNFPQVSLRDHQVWSGLRPMTPHMLPICNSSRASNRIWYHTGHGHLGWSMAAGTAKQLVQEIAQQLG